jgi:hypothetical protein
VRRYTTMLFRTSRSYWFSGRERSEPERTRQERQPSTLYETPDNRI